MQLSETFNEEFFLRLNQLKRFTNHEDKVTVEQADNGKMYLRSGEYKLKIEMAGKSSEVRFVIN